MTLSYPLVCIFRMQEKYTELYNWRPSFIQSALSVDWFSPCDKMEQMNYLCSGSTGTYLGYIYIYMAYYAIN